MLSRPGIGATLALAAAFGAVVAAAMIVPRGTVRFVDVPVAVLPIAGMELFAPSAQAALPSKRVTMLTMPEPDAGAGPPIAVDPALVETSPKGDIPRIAPDGRTALRHYARPATTDCSRPCVAVLITGLGLADRLTVRALALPGPVALSFSPYADAVDWQARARAAGHEALLALPLEPERFPLDDSGPLTVHAGSNARAAGDAVLRVLAAGSGYVALDAAAGAFVRQPGAFAAVARALHDRGLGVIEIGGNALAGPAHASGVAYLAAAQPIDLDPSPGAIDRALASVASEALRSGTAVAVAQPLPASFDRIAAWIATLPGQGLALVPPSRLLQRLDASMATRQ